MADGPCWHPRHLGAAFLELGTDLALYPGCQAAPRQPGRVGPPSRYTPTLRWGNHIHWGPSPLGGDMKMGSLLLLGDLHTVGVQKGVQSSIRGTRVGQESQRAPGPPNTCHNRASRCIFRSGNASSRVWPEPLRGRRSGVPLCCVLELSPPGMPRADQSFLEEPWEPPCDWLWSPSAWVTGW